MKILAAIALSICLACMGAPAMGAISASIDSAINQSKLQTVAFGLAMLMPQWLGAAAGALTGPLFVINDTKIKGQASCALGTLGFIACGIGFTMTWPNFPTEAFILCGPATLWMLLLILFGAVRIWKSRME